MVSGQPQNNWAGLEAGGLVMRTGPPQIFGTGTKRILRIARRWVLMPSD